MKGLRRLSAMRQSWQTTLLERLKDFSPAVSLS
jgi:hypothetical protein